MGISGLDHPIDSNKSDLVPDKRPANTTRETNSIDAPRWVTWVFNPSSEAAMVPDPDHLIPPPKQVEVGNKSWYWPEHLPIFLPTPEWYSSPAIRDLSRECLLLGRTLTLRTHQDNGNSVEESIRTQLRPTATLGDEGYHLTLGPQGIDIIATSDAGLFYAVQTLCQWLRLHRLVKQPTPLRAILLIDYPDLPNRGVMLDISRTKVPKMTTLLGLIDHFARWKINQLQLYMEHTFAYRGHEVVWRDTDPLTPDEVRFLVDYCQQRQITLVPNQNSFGHLHRWLTHPCYRNLAECPEGIDHVFSLEKEPFSLCPGDPGSLRLLSDWYQQLLPLFPAPVFNSGLDETFDLGQGRSKAECATRGKEEVYLDFLSRVHQLVGKHDKRMMFWGDIIMRRPDLLTKLPEDIIALEWGYERGHPFDSNCERLAASGRDFYVCPGTSSWSTIGGRFDNAWHNLVESAQAAHDHGASGYLTTDWGDYGHLQPLAVSYPGLIAGAALSWRTQFTARHPTGQVIHWLDAHLFQEAGLTAPLIRLGNAYQTCGFYTANGSPLFYLLLYPDANMHDHHRLQGFTSENLQTGLNYLAELGADLDTLQPQGPESGRTKNEIHWAIDVLSFAARFGQKRLTSRSAGPTSQALQTLVERHRQLWLARNRPAGLAESCHYLQRVEAHL